VSSSTSEGKDNRVRDVIEASRVLEPFISRAYYYERRAGLAISSTDLL